MSTPGLTFDWLPAPLRPRAQDDGGGPLRRSMELTVLIVLGLVLALATVNDTFTQVHIDERLAADKKTWHNYTRYPIKVGLTQGVGTKTDIACAPPASGADHRLCLVLSGPVKGGVRTIAGGYDLTLFGDDLYRRRYACFGEPLAASECSGVRRPADA